MYLLHCFVQTIRVLDNQYLDYFSLIVCIYAFISLADLGGGVRDARPPWASKFFRFHAVFGKIWRVHAPPGGFTPPLGKILDPPLYLASVVNSNYNVSLGVSVQ